MRTVIIPYRDSNRAGATEHVDAIINSLKVQSSDAIIAAPVEVRYEKDKAGNDRPFISGQITRIQEQYGADAHYIVITGDYGGEKTNPPDENIPATFKRILGVNTHIVASSYTAESQALMAAFSKGDIDYLALPEHATIPDVLQGTPAEGIISDAKEQNRLISMTAVPHTLTKHSLSEKHAEWKQAASEGKVAPIPQPDPARPMAMVMIPGDVEGPDGKPRLFTQKDAIKLADAVFDATPKTGAFPLFLVSNGPRTGKYNETLLDTPGFDANNPAFHNKNRMDSAAHNPVAAAFMKRLEARAGADNVISGCIAKGNVPSQGFLAFYDALNQHAANGGTAKLFIDGVSTTMMAQAANVLDPAIPIIACDTPAKNKTHIAGAEDLFNKGHIHMMPLDEHVRYTQRQNPIARKEAQPFHDAKIVANNVLSLIEQERTPGTSPSSPTARQVFPPHQARGY